MSTIFITFRAGSNDAGNKLDPSEKPIYEMGKPPGFQAGSKMPSPIR
jgi:hypothetical protein